jgi:lipopolysaccharide export system protein LptA
LAFLCTSLGLSFLSYIGQFNSFGDEHSIIPKENVHSVVDESFFKNVIYYSIDNSMPFLELVADELSFSSIDGLVIGFNPVGTIYRYEKVTNKVLDPIYFQAKNSRASLKTKDIYLENEVDLKLSNTNLKAQKVSILSAGEILYANNDVKTLSIIEKTDDELTVNANKAIYTPKLQTIEYIGNVNGLIKRKRLYEESINFKADLLTFKAPISFAELQGNVALNKKNLDAYANRGEVFLENYNKKLKYYALYDDVRLQEKLINNGRPLVRKAFAEKLEGLMSEKKIILTGLPKVFQERDVIKGNRIIIRENVETVEVDDANSNIILKKDKDQ